LLAILLAVVRRGATEVNKQWAFISQGEGRNSTDEDRSHAGGAVTSEYLPFSRTKRRKRYGRESAAKHESMKKQKKLPETRSSEIVETPAFPIPGNKLFERIGAAVAAARGYPFTNIEFARIIGRSESTTSNWFGVSPQPHLVSFFCLLEQLPPHDRHRVLDEICRDLPLADHPRLRHDPVAVASLKSILAEKTGITIIAGGTDAHRTFLLTALGHTFCRLDHFHRTAVGIDLHEPSWFVPIETVTYFKSSHPQSRTLEAIRSLWPTIRSSQQPLVLLNSIWSAAPETRKDIIAMADRLHVIVADQDVSLTRELTPGIAQRVHLLRIATARENPIWLTVAVDRRFVFAANPSTA
jgi:hypothetical protein